jgi:hypothetical protein
LFTLADLLLALGRESDMVDVILDALGREPSSGGYISEDHRRLAQETLREVFAGGDAEKLERFPTLTLRELSAAVRLSPRVRRRRRPPLAPPVALPDVSLDEPAPIPPDDAWPVLTDLGHGLQRGSLRDPDREPTFAASWRVAEVLNGLARNEPGSEPVFHATLGGSEITSPEGLIALLAQRDHTISMRDARQFANFGNLWYEGRPVVTPLWIDTLVPVPDADHTLRLPSLHSQHELSIDGPDVRATVLFYFGTDGTARWRADCGRAQPWIGRRVAHEYRGEEVEEIVRLAGAMSLAYAQKKQRHPDLALGGYYVLGVCNDSTALIELALQGRTTLYPLVRDLRYFRGAGEVDELARRLPHDRNRRTPPEWERLVGSIPEDDWERLVFPGLRRDLEQFQSRARSAAE